jgi:hypothetical protein
MRGETITAHIPSTTVTGEDAQGNPTFGPPTDLAVTGCLLAPFGENEDATPFGPVTMRGWHIYNRNFALTFTPDVVFTIRGVPGWQMDGLVGAWRKGTDKGVEWTVRRVS